MARAKSITTETLIELLTEYLAETPPKKKIKIPEFGKYIRSRGYEVEDYTIRRNKEFIQYVETVKVSREEVLYQELAAFQTLDVDAFLNKNGTKAKLKEALMQRDRYYAAMAENAAKLIQDKKRMEEQLKKSEERAAVLEAAMEKMQVKADNAKLKERDETIRKLRRILESYIYPDAANALLAKEGILEVASTVIPEEIMQEKTITADAEVQESEYKSVNKLMGGFH